MTFAPTETYPSKFGVQTYSGATEKDVEWARSYIRENAFNDEVVAAWRIPADTRAKVGKQIQCMGGVGVCPLFWPHLLMLTPCLCCARVGAQGVMAGTVYVLGQKNLYRLVDAKVGGGCYKSGKDTAYAELKDVTAVSVDAQASGIVACFAYPSLSVGLPLGSPLAEAMGGEGRAVVSAQFRMMVENPEEAARMIRQAKEQAQANVVGAAYQAPGQVSMGGGAGEDIPGQISKLKSLLDSGILTQEEFDMKKGELLARM